MATTPINMGASAKTAFTRTASGLVRNMSLWDAALFGLLSTGGAYTFILLYPMPQYLTPGVSIPLLIGVTLVFPAIVYFVYSALGSAMPRAGGDYVYETRTINRIVGFSIPWASNLVFWLVFPTTGAFVANTLGLIPICRAFGWDAAADWLSTAAGATVVVLVILLLQWSLAVFGLRFFRVAQRYVLIPFVVIGMATMIIVFAVKWNANFSQAFNAYNAGTGITYDSVRAAAAANGYVPTGFNLRNTMVWFVVLAGDRPLHHVRGAGHARRSEGRRQPPPAVPGLLFPRPLHGHRGAAHTVGDDAACRGQRLPEPVRHGLRERRRQPTVLPEHQHLRADARAE